MQETCQMRFSTSTDRTRLVSINEPRPNLSAALVQNAANSLINANPFDAETGALLALLSAHRVTVTRQTII